MKKIVNKEDMMIKVGKWIAKHKSADRTDQYDSADTVSDRYGGNKSQL